jgi:hypothetical protein
VSSRPSDLVRYHPVVPSPFGAPLFEVIMVSAALPRQECGQCSTHHERPARQQGDMARMPGSLPHPGPHGAQQTTIRTRNIRQTHLNLLPSGVATITARVHRDAGAAVAAVEALGRENLGSYTSRGPFHGRPMPRRVFARDRRWHASDCRITKAIHSAWLSQLLLLHSRPRAAAKYSIHDNRPLLGSFPIAQLSRWKKHSPRACREFLPPAA